MYAVIKTGGKQYRVALGDKVRIEQIPSGIGDVVTMDHVLSVSDGEKSLIGEPMVSGASVSATVIDQGKADKIRVFKMRRRKHYRKTQGHRQLFTEIFVSKIESSLGAESADAQEALDKAKARRERIANASVAAPKAQKAAVEPSAAPDGDE